MKTLPVTELTIKDDKSMKIEIEDLLGRVALICVGVFFGGVELYWLLQLLADPWGHDSWPLDLLVRVAGFLFMALIAVTTFIRLPAKNTAAGFQPRISAIAGSFLVMTLVVLPKGEISAAAKIVATVLIFVGTGLSAYCLFWLGRSFSVMAHARKLVTGGPYSVIRHPLYAAEMISFFGVALANFSLVATIIITITIAFQFRRMANEECVLRATFPEYEDYARQVPMFIPALSRRLIHNGE